MSEVGLVHTFSIVACDIGAGHIGVAVQSHWFGSGTIVPWAEAGVGAMATQSFADRAQGTRGLMLLRSGMAAPDVLAAMLAGDARAPVRQVGIVDSSGQVAAHTGARCGEVAAHHVGDGFCVMASLTPNEKVVPAMVQAYLTNFGDLDSRLLAALDAGEHAGGAVRGHQSSALLVVDGRAPVGLITDPVVDLRVEDHADPVGELQRLLRLRRGYQRMTQTTNALQRGAVGDAQRFIDEAAELAPKSMEIALVRAFLLASAGNLDQATPLFKSIVARDPSAAELIGHLHKPGIIPDTPSTRNLVNMLIKAAR